MNMEEITLTIEQNHKDAFKIIQYFFSFSDIFLVFIYLCISKFNLYYIKKLLSLMGIDIIIRIIKLSTYSISNSFYKEIFLTLFTCCQFILIMSFFNTVLSNLDSNYLMQNEIGYFEYIFFTIIFFFIIFPFEKLYFYKSKSFYFCKCVIFFLCLYYFYKYISHKYKDYIDNIKEKGQSIIILSILTNMPGLAFYCFSGKIFLYLLAILFKNKLLLSYLDMAQITLNETAKYSIFLVLSSLLYVWSYDFTEFNKDSKDTEKYVVTVNQAVD